MAAITCSLCVRDDDVTVVETLPDGRVTAHCSDCNFTWTYGTAREEPTTPRLAPEAEAFSAFPKAADVTPEAAARAADLKARFLSEVQVQPDERVAPFWAKYQHIFSADGLPTADPDDLKAFANSPVGAYVGFMTGFNNAWNEMGPEQGAKQTRQVIEYLLRGDDPSLESRLTDLIEGNFAFSMPGFKEALLTKALAVTQPDRFLTIVTYDQKAEMARSVYGLHLPKQDRISWTIGRLAVWSNDLLKTLVGHGFVNQQHAGDFLWWAKDQP